MNCCCGILFYGFVLCLVVAAIFSFDFEQSHPSHDYSGKGVARASFTIRARFINWNVTWNSSYSGQFLRGQKHGRGVYASFSGLVHDGEFEFDSRNGPATTTWGDGAKLEASWLDDRILTLEPVKLTRQSDSTQWVGRVAGDHLVGDGTLSVGGKFSVHVIMGDLGTVASVDPPATFAQVQEFAQWASEQLPRVSGMIYDFGATMDSFGGKQEQEAFVRRPPPIERSMQQDDQRREEL